MPTGGGGFEYFYGFIGGETNQWYPAIYEGTTPVEPEKMPEQGYHFTEDMTTKAIKEHVDHHLGRLIDALEDLEVLDDTLIYYIIGDNGASAEGTLNGTFNEIAALNGLSAIETPEFLRSRIDDFGGP